MPSGFARQGDLDAIMVMVTDLRSPLVNFHTIALAFHEYWVLGMNPIPRLSAALPVKEMTAA